MPYCQKKEIESLSRVGLTSLWLKDLTNISFLFNFDDTVPSVFPNIPLPTLCNVIGTCSFKNPGRRARAGCKEEKMVDYGM
jgi:hypothetical protein